MELAFVANSPFKLNCCKRKCPKIRFNFETAYFRLGCTAERTQTQSYLQYNWKFRWGKNSLCSKQIEFNLQLNVRFRQTIYVAFRHCSTFKMALYGASWHSPRHLALSIVFHSLSLFNRTEYNELGLKLRLFCAHTFSAPTHNIIAS